jgi:WD40 repeat protein
VTQRPQFESYRTVDIVQLLGFGVAGFLNAAVGLSFTPDGTRLAVGGGAEGLCKVWDVETWRELVSLPSDGDWFDEVRFSPDGGDWFDEVRFSPDGKLLGARTDRRTLQYWRAPSWEEIAKAK